MVDLDYRVLTPHVVEKTCNDRYPIMLKSISSGGVSVPKRVLQVETSQGIVMLDHFNPTEHVATLYTTEELQAWEEYHQLPSFQHSRSEKVLNALCTGDECSYGSWSLLAGMSMENFQKHIREGSEALLSSINPFGGFLREIEYLKTFLNTLLMLEYSMLAISVGISIVFVWSDCYNQCAYHAPHP